jgi:hypothetical protein
MKTTVDQQPPARIPHDGDMPDLSDKAIRNMGSIDPDARYRFDSLVAENIQYDDNIENLHESLCYVMATNDVEKILRKLSGIDQYYSGWIPTAISLFFTFATIIVVENRGVAQESATAVGQLVRGAVLDTITIDDTRTTMVARLLAGQPAEQVVEINKDPDSFDDEGDPGPESLEFAHNYLRNYRKDS